MQRLLRVGVEGIEPKNHKRRRNERTKSAVEWFHLIIDLALKNRRKVDDWLPDVAELKRLEVAEWFDGGKAALPWFVRLPGSQKPVQGQDGGGHLS